MRDLLRSWRDPGYWRWRWLQVSRSTRMGLAVLLVSLIGIGGYLTAMLAGSATTSAAYLPPTPESVTIQQTVIHRVKGTARVVTEVRRVAVPSSSRERVVTSPGTGETVVREVTVQRPGRDRVVTTAQTRTVLDSQTVERPVTVTTPSGPERTVTNNVTSPGRTVTVNDPAQTITTTVTSAPRTVTETITNTVTTTDMVTTTETVTVTVPCKKPC